jgi:hypothetical protein
MLFDLKGKRRRVVQGVYLSLAILMGGGLVLFGIGSDVSGGLGDLFTGGGGGDNQAEETAQKRVTSAEKTLATDPDNEAALAQLVRSHYQLATIEASAETSEFTQKAVPELEATADAWERYSDAADKIDPSLGRFAIQAYEGLATLEEEPQDQSKHWAGAAGAAEEIASADQKAQNYILLVQYASLAGQTRKADLAGKKAIELAPKGQKKQAKAAVEQAKQQAGQQAAGGAQPAPAPAP